MAKARKKKFGTFQTSGLVNASKTLLANIRFASVDDPIKTLCITSSVPDEGKTTLSTNLACAIASAGHSVLIIDADMRNRSLAHILDLHPKQNLYSILAGECSIEAAITPTEYDNLYFLDSEPGIPNPSDILSTHRFEALVNMLRDMFDYVIFDTPPIDLFIDAAIISALTDGTILAIRERSTKKVVVERSIAQLKASKGRILGIVCTFTKSNDSDYYYAYYTQGGKRVSKKEKEKIDEERAANGEPSPSAKKKPRVSNKQLSSDDIEVWARRASRQGSSVGDYARHAAAEEKLRQTGSFDPITPNHVSETKTGTNNTISGPTRVKSGNPRERSNNNTKKVVVTPGDNAGGLGANSTSANNAPNPFQSAGFNEIPKKKRLVKRK
jgi:capsular exopolysaccharide synthesis family protein